MRGLAIVLAIGGLYKWRQSGLGVREVVGEVLRRCMEGWKEMRGLVGV